jgi:HAD superfamily hydrolase (TIGR01509 family)
MLIEALIFDFDGLIVDTETLHYQTWSSLFNEHGVELALERWLLDLGTHGMFDPHAELQNLTGKTFDRQALLDRHRSNHHKLVEAEALRPGVRALIEAAYQQGLGLAVASSSSLDWVERWLVHHDIRHRFRCVRSRDDVARVKPDPELFLSAAACLDVEPAACVVFEDSPNGMRAARAAGMRCVAVPTSLLATVELPEVALRLSSLGEYPLEHLLEQLETMPVPNPQEAAS